MASQPTSIKPEEDLPVLLFKPLDNEALSPSKLLPRVNWALCADQNKRPIVQSEKDL